MKKRYDRAASRLRALLDTREVQLTPEWLSGDRCRYIRSTDEGVEQVEVDYSEAPELTVISRSCTRAKSNDDDVSLVSSEQEACVASPCGRFVIQLFEDDLYCQPLSSNTQSQRLTQDGGQGKDYHYSPGFPDFLTNPAPKPSVCWSLDSRYIAVQSSTQADVGALDLLQMAPSDGSRPILHRHRVALPGDQALSLVQYSVIEISTGAIIDVDRVPMPSHSGDPIGSGWVFWGEDQRLYCIDLTRGQKSMQLVRFDPKTSQTELLIEKNSPTFVQPTPFFYGCPPVLELVPEINGLILYAQDDGWGHLYFHDLTSGECKYPITSGNYNVTWIHHIDRQQGVIYFSAVGREEGRNPYYPHFYRVNFDGSHLRLLTPENCFHDIPSPISELYDHTVADESSRCGMSADGRVFIDTMSCVDQSSVSVLRSAEDGRILQTLAQSHLGDTRSLPTSFNLKASDKKTDLYGVLYRPSDFDASKVYPVILSLYGGPQVTFTAKRYANSALYMGGNHTALAELGFVVVTVDPRGTPLRGKTFQDDCYGHMDNGGGIDDQVAVLNQLAQRYSWMDMERVGITGYSGGGFASARAMFTHSDLFKVAVSAAGNHDQRLFVSWWAETFHGLYEGRDYHALSNTSLASQLKGKLLLVHGDMDTSVHIAHTMQLANTLIEHGKDFDMLVMPNRGHIFMDDPYFIKRTWDYFVEHLLGECAPQHYSIKIS